MICSSVNVLFLMSTIFLGDGLLLIQVGTAGGGQVTPTPHSTVTLFARFRGLSTSVPRAQAVW